VLRPAAPDASAADDFKLVVDRVKIGARRVGEGQNGAARRYC
jgi:hypothetical protein